MNSHPPVRLFKESDYIDSLTNLCMEKILENLKKIFLVQNKPPISECCSSSRSVITEFRRQIEF